ncbi:MAG: hypothetical protein AAGF93_04025 [Cyanobacteria bacterium P01_H01_bin.105]
MSIIPNPLSEGNKKWINLSLAFIAAFGFGIGSGAVHTIYTFESRNHESESQCVQASLSLADYNRLELGDTLKEVQFILGVGIEQSSSSSQSVYLWANPDSSHIKAIFRNGVLQSKEQSELPSNVCIAHSE